MQCASTERAEASRVTRENFMVNSALTVGYVWEFGIAAL